MCMRARSRFPTFRASEASDPVSLLQPSDANEIAEMISWVVQEGDSLEIVGGGTKRALGRPMKTDHVLDVSRFEGIVAYEPAELVLTVRPGEPLASINAELKRNRQMLAFEPPDWRALLGAEGAETLGEMRLRFRTACSIQARCSRSSAAAPSLAACMCMRARWRFPTFRASEASDPVSLLQPSDANEIAEMVSWVVQAGRFARNRRRRDKTRAWPPDEDGSCPGRFEI